MGSDNENPGPESEQGNSKAGWFLLGAAALLAGGSIAVNVMDSGGGASSAQQSADVPPSVEELRAIAESSSEDADPWSELAFAHFQRGEFSDAAGAYQRAVAIDGEEAVLWSALGESLVYASARDPLPPAALAAFEKAIALDPSDPRARYFLAVKKDLEADHEGAITAWLDLLSDTPPGAPWEQDLVRTIQQVGAINEIEVEQRLARVLEGRTPPLLAAGSGSAAGLAASPNVRGPSAADIAAAGSLSPAEQRSMAEGMVAQLEARLQNEPQNLDGWLMLMRSRMNLGEPGKAKAALDAALAANPGEADQLREQAAALGIR